MHPAVEFSAGYSVQLVRAWQKSGRDELTARIYLNRFITRVSWIFTNFFHCDIERRARRWCPCFELHHAANCSVGVIENDTDSGNVLLLFDRQTLQIRIQSAVALDPHNLNSVFHLDPKRHEPGADQPSQVKTAIRIDRCGRARSPTGALLDNVCVNPPFCKVRLNGLVIGTFDDDNSRDTSSFTRCHNES